MLAGKLKRAQIAEVVWGALSMAVAAVLWAVAELLVTRLPRGVSVPTIVLTRYATHLVALVALNLGRSPLALARTRRPALQIGRGLLMLGMPLCSVVAVARAPVGTVWAIFWVTPLLVVALARLVARRPVSWQLWVAGLLGTLGVMLMIRPGGAGLLAAAVPALGMAFCFSLYLVLTRLLRDEATGVNLFYTGASVLVPLLIAAPFFWQRPPLAAWPILIAIGLVGLVALYAFDKACEAAPPARLAPLLCLQPATLLAVTFLTTGSGPGRMGAAGGAAIVVAVALALSGPGEDAAARRE